MGKGQGGGRSQSVEVKVMDTPAGEGCQGKEASGEAEVLDINLGSYSLNTKLSTWRNIYKDIQRGKNIRDSQEPTISLNNY